MSDLEESFAKLLGRQPTDKERQDLYRVRDALGLKSNDALWLVLMVLQHYQNQYEQFPARIEGVAREMLQTFRLTAEAVAKAAAENARYELANAVAAAARDVARHVEASQRLKWLLATVATCVVALSGLGWFMHTKGEQLGYASGYGAARDERAAASWAASTDGKVAYRLAQAGSLLQLARCSMPGWYIKDGVCFPAQARDGLYGWRVEPR